MKYYNPHLSRRLSPTRYSLFLLLLFVTTLSFSQDEPPSYIKIETFNEGSSFSCVTVDVYDNVWTGTEDKGLFFLNTNTDIIAENFRSILAPVEHDLNKFKIQAIAADNNGDVWIGHAGLGGSVAVQGGIEQYNANTQTHIKHYASDSHAPCLLNRVEKDGLATRNVVSLFIDSNKTVWSAHNHHSFIFDGKSITTPIA